MGTILLLVVLRIDFSLPSEPGNIVWFFVLLYVFF